jgi:hypothetical protein
MLDKIEGIMKGVFDHSVKTYVMLVAILCWDPDRFRKYGVHDFIMIYLVIIATLFCWFGIKFLRKYSEYCIL